MCVGPSRTGCLQGGTDSHRLLQGGTDSLRLLQGGTDSLRLGRDRFTDSLLGGLRDLRGGVGLPT